MSAPDAQDILAPLYYSTKGGPGAFSGPEALYQAAVAAGHKDITRKVVDDFLTKQYSYQLHKRAYVQHPKFGGVIVTAPDQQWDIDTLHLPAIARYNNGVRYILVAIDILSKRGWLEPIGQRITAKNAATAFEHIIDRAGVHPNYLRSDDGTEFRQQFAQMLQQMKIKHIIARGSHKANYAER